MSPSRFGSGRRVQVNQSGGRYRAENSSRTSAPYSLVSLHVHSYFFSFPARKQTTEEMW